MAYWSRLIAPTVAAAASFATAACSPLVLLNALVPSGGYDVHAGLAYGSADRQRLDLYVPHGAPSGAPVIVFFYGGSWTTGDRRLYRFVGEAFAMRGYRVAIPDYRLHPEVRFPTFVEDGAVALSWLREHAGEFGFDRDRFVLVGHSAGAHIAALIALDQRYLAAAGVPRESVRGVVGLAGPYAFDPLAYASTRPIFAGLSHPDEARPITFATGSAPAMLLIHGADDRTVLPENSRELAAAILQAGGHARVVEIPETGHVGVVLSFASLFRGRDAVFRETLAFIGPP